jgi:hypothetical protein
MSKYSRFDPKENVIATDVTGVSGTRESIDEIFDELTAVAKSLRRKVWVVACWKQVTFDEEGAAEYYGKRTAELLHWVKGVMRYGADDPLTRSYIRTQTLKHRAEGTRSNLFETRREALAAVRAAEAAEKQ